MQTLTGTWFACIKFPTAPRTYRARHGRHRVYLRYSDALAYDAAICLNAWCFEPDASFNVTKGQAFLAAYQSVRALDAQEIAALPVLARGAALRFLLTRLVDWLNVPVGALVRPKDPMEYVKKLRFHQHVKSAADYGLLA